MKNARPVKPDYEPRRCVICGEIFTPTRKNQVACSDLCRQIRAVNRGQAYREKKREAGSLAPRPCAVCGAMFTPLRKDQKCCSDVCRGKYMLRACRARYQTKRQGE